MKRLSLIAASLALAVPLFADPPPPAETEETVDERGEPGTHDDHGVSMGADTTAAPAPAAMTHRCDIERFDEFAARNVSKKKDGQLSAANFIEPPDFTDAAKPKHSTLCNKAVWTYIQARPAIKNLMWPQGNPADLSAQVLPLRGVDETFYKVDEKVAALQTAAEKIIAAADRLKLLEKVDRAEVAEPLRPAALTKVTKVTIKGKAELDMSQVGPHERAKALEDLFTVDGTSEAFKARPGALYQDYFAKLIELRETLKTALPEHAAKLAADDGAGPNRDFDKMNAVAFKAAGCPTPLIDCWETGNVGDSVLAQLDPLARNRVWMTHIQLAAIQAAVAAATKKAADKITLWEFFDRLRTETGAAQADKSTLDRKLALEDRIRGATADNMGLRALYDKAKGSADDSWKEGADATQVAAVEALRAGTVETGGKGQAFVFTPKKDADPVYVPISADLADGKEEALVATGARVADQLRAGNDSFAKLTAAAAAVEGQGDPSPDGDLPAGDQGPAGPAGARPDLTVRPATDRGLIGGAKKAVGCAQGQTLADYQDRLSKARREEAADSSRDRQKAYDKYDRAFKDADEDFAGDDDAQKVLKDPFLTRSQKEAHPAVVAARRTREDAVAAADRELEAELQRLGTEAAQDERLRERTQVENAEALRVYKEEIAGRIEDLRGEWTDGGDEQISDAKRWVDKNIGRYLQVKYVRQYFGDEWPADKSGKYGANFAQCSDPKTVRMGTDGDVERCLGQKLKVWVANYVSRQAGSDDSAGAPAAPETAAQRRKRLTDEARKRELARPAQK